MLALFFVFLQAVSSSSTFTYMPLESAFKAWLQKQGAVQASDDSLLGRNRLGTTVVRTYKTNQGPVRITLHLTNEGAVWDAGLFSNQLHQPALYGYRDFIFVLERAALAVYFGDIQFARTTLSLKELSLDNGVGSADERIKVLFNAVKGFNTSIAVASVRFEKGLFYGAFESKTAKTTYKFNLSIKPSANVFLNGQFYLLQNALAQSINNVHSPINDHQIWSTFISATATGDELKLRFPEFKPYGTELLFRKENGRWVAQAGGNVSVQDPDHALRAFWTAIALPDSFWAGTIIIPPATVSVQSETRTVHVNRVMKWKEFEQWMKHLMPEVLPVYYGTMTTGMESTDGTVRIGSWSFVDPHLKMEHLFKVTQKLRAREGKLELFDVSVQGTFCVRLDNIEDLYGSKTGGTFADFPAFKLDVRKKQQ